MEIDRMTTPLDSNFLYAASMSGASATHAAHQLAPKVSHTGCPLYELSDTFSPVTVVPVKSCAGLPIFGAAPPPGPDSSTAVVPDAAAGHSGVQVGAVDEPGEQRGRLLGVPAPVGAPGDLRPDRAQDDDQGEQGEADDDGAVAQLVQDGRLGQSAPALFGLDQVEAGRGEGDRERAVGDDRDGDVDGQQQVVLQCRRQQG